MAKALKKLEYDLNSLQNCFQDKKDNKSTLGVALLKKAIFIDKKLTELEADIDENGLNVEMPQGNYSIMRANPSINSYNMLLKNYNTIVKQIVALLPSDVPTDDEISEKYF